MIEITNKGTTIQSLQIGVGIIDVIVNNGKPMKFPEIQEKTKMTKSNLYKYMNTLTQLDLLTRENSTGLYHLGSKLIQYGATAIGNQDVLELVTPYLQAISQHTNCSVLLASATTNGPIIAKIWSPDRILNIGAQIGTLLPPNSSTGKIFNVFYNGHITENWRKTAEPTLKEGDKEFLSIREEKIAFTKEPLIASISSVSFPILSYSRDLIGIITVVGFTQDIPTAIADSVSQYLLKMQEELSKTFGYTS
ncbi:IclR family transcriptional regulator [Sporosarcina beigongshangi]|uniref:IclR family transcriptional regulator n=1 Tax=Sporosarcina beigongshangi TaxID=2782538 RepID=UPI001939DCE9|nr:helix-turn-helix domain-containing protein [Sporosarcina beigongshangi]